MSTNTLFVYTHSYPYGNGEQFLRTELKVLSTYFDKIILVPAFCLGHKRNIDEANIHVFNYSKENEHVYKPSLFQLVRIFVSEILNSDQRFIYLKRIRYYLAFIKNALKKANNLFDIVISKYPDSTHYTYWFGDETFQLSLLKANGKIKKLVTRGHGGDIYEYQHLEPMFFFPFRNYQLKYINKLAIVSKDGIAHLKQKFPNYTHKLNLSYLACQKFYSPSIKNEQIFTVVSCSTFYHYKRIPFLIEALSRCKSKINWIHIGDGGDEKVKSERLLESLPKNISYTWKGFLNTDQLQQFYKSTFIDLFINVSNSEGLPVTLMEAISAGTPIIATNVGGVSEIANKQTGILIDKNILPNELASLIDNVVSNKIKLPAKETIIDFWEKNFSETNYHQFYSEILCAE